MKKIVLVSLLIVSLGFIGWIISQVEAAEALAFDEKHNDRSFLFLLYSIDVKVNDDWSYITKVHKKAKIIKDDAQSLGEIPIYYENGREQITELEAFTLAPDNKKHDPTKIQDLNAYAGYPMYSDFMVRVVTLPEVTVGSVLEHRFTVVSKGLPVKNSFWYLYSIDADTPMKELHFSITMPKSLGIKYREFGLTRKPTITETPKDITYSWTIADIEEGDDPEDYLPPPTPESYKESFEFSSIGSWRDISDWGLSLVKKYMKITPEIKETAARLTKGKTTIKDKTRAILEYIQKDFRYVSMSFGDNTLEPHPTDEVFKNKYGDCKDLSLLCKAMLEAAGVSSNICLFNTEFAINDPQYDLPVPSLFDHVLLLVKDGEEGDFYADPLLKGYDIGEYPVAYQMAYVFVITEDGGKFGRLPVFDENRNYTGVNRTISIEADGSAMIETEAVWDLDFSIEHRERLMAFNKKEMDKFNEAIDTYLASGGEMIKRELRGLNEKYGIIKPYNKIKRTNAYPVTGGLMIIDIDGFDRGSDFIDKKRENPVFYPINSINEEVTTYRIPKGYSIAYMPPDVTMNNGFVSISRKYLSGPEGIKVAETTRFKRIELPNTEYDKLKEFYDKLSSTTQQRIIIKEAGVAQ